MPRKKEPSFTSLQEQLPDIIKAFKGLHDAATKGGVLSVKVKELMLIAVSVALR